MSHQAPEAPTPTYASLDQIRHELDLQLGEQERRGSSFDTKAGLLLGFAAVLIGLAPDQLNVLHVIGQVLAAVAAAAAVGAIFPRISANLSPRDLRNNYLTTDPVTTKLRLLDTRIWLYEQDDQRLTDKVFRMKLAVFSLVAAVLLMLIGSMVETATDGGDDDREDAPPAARTR